MDVPHPRGKHAAEKPLQPEGTVAHPGVAGSGGHKGQDLLGGRKVGQRSPEGRFGCSAVHLPMLLPLHAQDSDSDPEEEADEQQQVEGGGDSAHPGQAAGVREDQGAKDTRQRDRAQALADGHVLSQARKCAHEAIVEDLEREAGKGHTGQAGRLRDQCLRALEEAQELLGKDHGHHLDEQARHEAYAQAGTDHLQDSRVVPSLVGCCHHGYQRKQHD
mmetsp:Transcript_48782/g.109732  ORF Transcript_48782/g.109732 Transcript_48782/m.109732 type:complete len:218 (-) Transcript_48782:441-1094(-)